MRIERKEDEFIETFGSLKDGNSIFGERLPVAHCRNGDRIDVRLEGRDKLGALALRKDANR